MGESLSLSVDMVMPLVYRELRFAACELYMELARGFWVTWGVRELGIMLLSSSRSNGSERNLSRFSVN